MAKLFAAQMAEEVGSLVAIEIHGGYGFVEDYAVGKYWRDCRVFHLRRHQRGAAHAHRARAGGGAVS